MKLFLVAFAVIAAVAADVSHLPSNEYLPPVVQEAQIAVAPSNEYLPPVQAEVAPAHELADDGYRYKTHKRVVLRRHRRDVNELPSNEYLPPVAPSNEYLAPVEAAPETILADDGYRYKTHKRVVVRRHRRDVNELSNEYLPPFQAAAPSNEYLPPTEEVVAAPETILADDGYRYKTHKRVVVRRHRRDVNELPSNEYLPPVAPSNEYLAPVEAAPETILADDGYRYKTHKRVVVRRHRRDVSHLPSNEYLPPVQAAAPSNEYLPPVQVAAPAPVQIAAPAPVQYSAPAPAPVQVAAPVQIAAPAPAPVAIQVAAPAPAPVEVEAAPAHELAADGYRYKTHRRVVYRRHRRDVNELPSNEYLPPVSAPSNEYLAPVEVAPETVLADDGYRYKTHKRVVVRRHRRDVNELPSNEYLPPVAPSNEYLAPVEAAPETILADDGYRYKTHKRVVVRRHRRDVNELPSNEYLPPVDAPSNEYLAPVENTVEVAPAHVLADDGYRYKTHKRVVVRRH
ncbi:fibrous sheath CABYR-binding protein [Drosophila bipectinata]|uniref:fibrous sheath CABYR-binding protein n=1 Tax=Drosophila bipectinata TaxID=42026 RepID=UPI001C8A9C5B|nr:fibrous sheath CABYR-binding protein [Drosophila bipectinata]